MPYNEVHRRKPKVPTFVPVAAVSSVSTVTAVATVTAIATFVAVARYIRALNNLRNRRSPAVDGVTV